MTLRTAPVMEKAASCQEVPGNTVFTNVQKMFNLLFFPQKSFFFNLPYNSNSENLGRYVKFKETMNPITSKGLAVCERYLKTPSLAHSK